MTLESQLKEKTEKYRKLTEQALKEIEFSEGLNAEKKKIADDYMKMAENYFSDAKHFMEKGDLLTALAAFSYAHAWLDAGVRAKLFKTENGELFTLP